MTPIMMYDTCMIKQKESIREKLRNSIYLFFIHYCLLLDRLDTFTLNKPSIISQK